MAGKTKHLIKRQGNFYARIVVPVALRPFVGKTELREPLGSNRRIAEQNLHSTLVGFHAQLDDARRRLPTPASAKKQSGWRGASIRELARAHYEAELRIDDIERFGAAPDIDLGIKANERVRLAPDMVRELDRDFRDAYVKSLRKLASGVVSAKESAEGFVEATIGWGIDRLIDEPKNGNWRWARG